jgi:hypothetical protein
MISMKGRSQMVFHTPFHPPKMKDQLPKADLRREITPWRALVWAYADECVGVATNVPDSHHLYCANGLSQTTYGERMARGSINGALDAHEDAFAIDGFVYAACGGAAGLKPYHAIRSAAEKRVIIPAEIEVPDICCLPRLNKRGEPWLEYPIGRNDRPYLCLVTYEGYPADQASMLRKRHALFYDLFQNVLASMQDIVGLTRWRVLPHQVSKITP